MKIALIDPSLFTWPYDVHLAQGLTDNGNQAVIFGRNPGRTLPPFEAPFLRRHFYPGFESGLIKRLPKNLFLGLKGLSHIESMFRLVGALRRWKPDVIHFTEDLPKTRSGKIMRRILRKIAGKEIQQLEDLGDISTLANPQIVEKLWRETKSY